MKKHWKGSKFFHKTNIFYIHFFTVLYFIEYASQFYFQIPIKTFFGPAAFPSLRIATSTWSKRMFDPVLPFFVIGLICCFWEQFFHANFHGDFICLMSTIMLPILCFIFLLICSWIFLVFPLFNIWWCDSAISIFLLLTLISSSSVLLLLWCSS